MTSQADVILGPDEWVELSDGSANVLVQLKSGGSCGIFVGTAAPVGDYSSGLILGIKAFEASFSELVSGDKVFGRSSDGDQIIAVVKT